MSRTPSLPIPLTTDHLAEGQATSCYTCPVALALDEATGQQWHVMTYQATLELDSGHNLGWRLPPPVRALIRAIDAGEPVAPCTIQLPGRFRQYLREVPRAELR